MHNPNKCADVSVLFPSRKRNETKNSSTLSVCLNSQWNIFRTMSMQFETNKGNVCVNWKREAHTHNRTTNMYICIHMYVYVCRRIWEINYFETAKFLHTFAIVYGKKIDSARERETRPTLRTPKRESEKERERYVSERRGETTNGKTLVGQN